MSLKKGTRIAIVDQEKCKPSKCKSECKKTCPVNTIGKKCIEIADRKEATNEKKISKISEDLCIGCGACVRKCPFNAIQIINLPHVLDNIIFKYDHNSFQVHNLPMPKKGYVLGLIGANGCGKTTCLQILCNKILPNFGDHSKVSTTNDVTKYYRGSELQKYFGLLYKNSLKIVTKSQYVETLLNQLNGTVEENINKANTLAVEELQYIYDKLSLHEFGKKNINVLSGGQLQRFAIAMTLIQQADVYMFDEPSSYLDIKQRIKMAEAIRVLLLKKEKYVIVVEHDMSVLDYLSDHICMLYGKPGVYGVVSLPYSVREGINMFLDGYIDAENMRFRADKLNFKFTIDSDLKIVKKITENEKENDNNEIEVTQEKITYPVLKKTYPGFNLHVQSGDVYSSEVTVLVGENGTGKTTFIRMLCGLEKSDNNTAPPELVVSYKPQIIKAKFEGTVEELFNKKIKNSFHDEYFVREVIKPLQIEHLMDHPVKTLSGGEAQRVAIILALGRPADIYLIDEPSAYLDIEQRLIVAKIIKKFIVNHKKYCFLVEHDFIMSTYLAAKVIIFSKSSDPVGGSASCPHNFAQGFNLFLKELGVTFRRDTTTYRPRINKLNSQNDKIQKEKGDYFMFEPQSQILPEKSHIIPASKDTNLEW